MFSFWFLFRFHSYCIVSLLVTCYLYTSIWLQWPTFLMGIIKVSFYSKGRKTLVLKTRRYWVCFYVLFIWRQFWSLISLCPQVLKPVVSPEVNHGLGNRRLINFSLSGTMLTSIFLSFHPFPYCFSPELEGHLISVRSHTLSSPDSSLPPQLSVNMCQFCVVYGNSAMFSW